MNQLELFAQNSEGTFLLILAILIIWTMAWKGVALWKSARLTDKWWFIALLVINTVGILEILYIFVFSKRKVMDAGESTESTNERVDA